MCYPTSVVMLVFMKGVPSSAAVSRGNYRGQGVIIYCCTKSPGHPDYTPVSDWQGLMLLSAIGLPVDITAHVGAALMCLLFLSAIRVV